MTAARRWVGLAGWANPPVHKQVRSIAQTHLQYYAAHFACVEVNSTFYRQHRASTYKAWCVATPPSFRFSLKMPRSITHDAGLRNVAAEVDAFFSSVEMLQSKLAVILVQLPPSLEFDARLARHFFRSIPRRVGTHVVCEPRHASWFTGAANSLLERLAVGRVAADPSAFPVGERPGGDLNFHYFRWHGSPRMYYSSYGDERLDRFIALIDAQTPTWCVFDNTARHAAWDNALRFDARGDSPRRQPSAL